MNHKSIRLRGQNKVEGGIVGRVKRDTRSPMPFDPSVPSIPKSLSLLHHSVSKKNASDRSDRP